MQCCGQQACQSLCLLKHTIPKNCLFQLWIVFSVVCFWTGTNSKVIQHCYRICACFSIIYLCQNANVNIDNILINFLFFSLACAGMPFSQQVKHVFFVYEWMCVCSVEWWSVRAQVLTKTIENTTITMDTRIHIDLLWLNPTYTCLQSFC